MVDDPRRRSAGAQVAILAFATAISLIVFLALTSIPAALAARDARSTSADARDQLSTSDFNGLVASVESLQSDVNTMASIAATPEWFAAQFIPYVGAPIHAWRTVAEQGAAVLNASDGFISVAKDFSSAPRAEGQVIPDDALNELSSASSRLSMALRDLGDSLKSISVNGAYGPLQDTAQRLLADAADTIPKLQQMLSAIPAVATLLGAQGNQNWLVVLQNGGESRATGGLVGSYASVDFDHGKMTAREVGPNNNLFYLADSSVLPEDTRKFWGAARLAQIFGVNLSPHFPYAAEMLSSIWQKKTGSLPDAVMAVDQRAAAALLRITGPIVVQDNKVDADNVVRWLTVDVYAKYGEGAEKDAFVTDLLSELLARIAISGDDQAKVVPALLNLVLERGLFLWAKDNAVEAGLDTPYIGGTLPPERGPFAMAVVSNNGANKLDAFLHTQVHYEGGQCIGGGRRVKLAVTLSNQVPDEQLPHGVDPAGKGSMDLRVALYAPTGAFLAGASPEPLYSGSERSHPASMFSVKLVRGQSQVMNFEFTQFGSASELNSTPLVLPEPMINEQQIQIDPGAPCSDA